MQRFHISQKSLLSLIHHCRCGSWLNFRKSCEWLYLRGQVMHVSVCSKYKVKACSWYHERSETLTTFPLFEFLVTHFRSCKCANKYFNVILISNFSNTLTYLHTQMEAKKTSAKHHRASLANWYGLEQLCLWLNTVKHKFLRQEMKYLGSFVSSGESIRNAGPDENRDLACI